MAWCALAVAAVVLGVMGAIPGMPNVAFLLLSATCAGVAWLLLKRERETRTRLAEAVAEAPAATAPAERMELGWEDVTSVDPLGLEVGYRLIPLVDVHQGGELMGRIKSVRRKLSQELGFLVPAVHIRDNLDLGPNTYRITLMGVPMGEAEVHNDRLMAINPGQVHGTLQGIATQDPAFGLEAVWIESGQRELAQSYGYTVVDPATVIATHLSHILQGHAHELLSHQDVQQLLDRLVASAPKLVEDLVPKRLGPREFFGELGLLIAGSTLVGWWACTVAARNLRIADPGCIVWDEVVAFWLILWLAMPMGFWGQTVAFALFRGLEVDHDLTYPSRQHIYHFPSHKCYIERLHQKSVQCRQLV